jgi:tetratricopeptide (TPR) repeat protein
MPPGHPAEEGPPTPIHIQVNEPGPGGTVYAVSGGDMHIRNAYPVYRVEPFPLESAPVSRSWPVSRLLTAEARVVPFSGRARELADLVAWRDTPAAGMSLLFLHGPGGQGKTRLAGRFAELSHGAGWTVWAAHHLSDPTGLTQVAIDPPADRLVVIVDYADRWPPDDLLLLLRNPLLTQPRRTRVLLIGRAPGIWWPTLRHRLGKSGGTVAGTIELGPHAATDDERRAGFAAARDRFAAADLLDVPAPESIRPPRDLTAQAFGLVLTTHMAALAAVDARKRGASPPDDPAGLSAYLLDREHDHWQSLYDHGQVSVEPQTMARVVYTAMLAGPLSRDRAARVLRESGLASEDMDAARLVDAHAVCYPPATGLVEHVLQPLYPDRLGEDLIALRSPGHSRTDYQADGWAGDALARIAGPAGEQQRVTGGADTVVYSWTQRANATLIQTAARWPHMGREYLFPLLRRYPRLGIIAGGTALTELARNPDIDSATLNAVYKTSPHHGHAEAGIGFAEIAQRLNDSLPSEAPLAQRMMGYREVAWQLSETAYFEADPNYMTRAAQILDKAVALGQSALRRPLIPRRLSRVSGLKGDADDDRLRADLATFQTLSAHYRRLAADQVALRESQHLRADTLLELGLNRGATGTGLDQVRQGLALMRRLALADPDTYRGELAERLKTVGMFWSIDGMDEEALASVSEGAQLLREAVPGSASERLHYALVLVDVSYRHVALARSDEAVAAAREAAAIQQDLAAASPDYEAGLGITLRFLAGALVAQGSHAEALAVASRSVRIARETDGSGDPPDDLVQALSTQGLALSGLGDTDGALAATREAIELCGPPGSPVDPGQARLQRELPILRMVAELRNGATDRVDAAVTGLALRDFAAVRLALGAELSEAVAAAADAVRLLDENHATKPTVSMFERTAAHKILAEVRQAQVPTRGTWIPGQKPTPR